MEKITTAVPFRQVDSVDDPLTEIAPEGARQMLAVVEADAFVAQHSGLALPDGRQRVVRHGHGPLRTIQTGVGALEGKRCSGSTSHFRLARSVVRPLPRAWACSRRPMGGVRRGGSGDGR